MVMQGCRRSPLAMDRYAIPPGGDATLTFPLQMHPGMDGPHEFKVLVPGATAACLRSGLPETSGEEV